MMFVSLVTICTLLGAVIGPRLYSNLRESHIGNAKFCDGSNGLISVTIWVDSDYMCTLTGDNSSSTISTSGSPPSLYYSDVVDLIDTAMVPSEQELEWDIAGYYYHNIPTNGTNTQLQLANGKNQWAWSDKMFYLGLPKEWYKLFTLELLSSATQCYNTTLYAGECPTESSVGIRTILRTGTTGTYTSETTTQWTAGTREGYVAYQDGMCLHSCLAAVHLA